jgi:membrane protease YdiL (CAAX protease family)
VFGLGAVSLFTDADIIAVPGLGPVPGIVGMLSAVAGFALMLWSALRRQHPSFFATITIALVAGLAHLAGVWVAVLFGSGSIVIATAVAGDLVRGGASAVLLLAAAVAAWGGIALRRTRARRPRWRWEADDDE